MSVVGQAIKYGQEFYKDDLHQREKNTADLAARFVRANYTKKQIPTVRIEDYYYHKPQKQLHLPGAVANTIHQVIKEAVIPEIMVYSIPRDEIYKFRKGRHYCVPRCWLSAENESVILFCPYHLQEKKVFAEVAIIMDGFHGICAVKDIDSKEIFLADIPQQDELDVCVYGLEIELR